MPLTLANAGSTTPRHAEVGVQPIPHTECQESDVLKTMKTRWFIPYPMQSMRATSQAQVLQKSVLGTDAADLGVLTFDQASGCLDVIGGVRGTSCQRRLDALQGQKQGYQHRKRQRHPARRQEPVSDSSHQEVREAQTPPPWVHHQRPSPLSERFSHETSQRARRSRPPRHPEPQSTRTRVPPAMPASLQQS